MNSILTMYKFACSGNFATKCTGANTVTFAGLRSAAFALYGNNPFDPRFAYFRDQGNVFGVNY